MTYVDTASYYAIDSRGVLELSAGHMRPVIDRLRHRTGRRRRESSFHAVVRAHCRPFASTFRTTTKITSEMRNLSVTARDANAMRHAAAEAWTQRLAAGRGDGYRLAAPSAQPERGTGSGPAC